MQFIDNAPLYKLVRITGPKHNLLVLKLSSQPVEGDLVMECLDEGQKCPHPISADEVRMQVARALEDYSAADGRRHFVEKVQFVSCDSRPTEVYYEMAKEILKRVSANQ